MMKCYKLDTLKLKWKNTEIIYKWEWIIIGVIFLMLLPNFFYNDIIVTTRHGMNVWNCIADHYSILDFYNYNSIPEHLHTYSYIPTQTAAYSFMVYLVFAIWNLPLFFLERFGKVDVFANPVIVFYAKSILIMALIFSATLFKRVCKVLMWSKKKSSWATYMYMTSAMVMSCIVVIGQYDIFSLCFIFLGILGYLEKNQKRFLFWFSIAFLFKPFALLVCIPLILLNEKKIIKIILNTMVTMIPFFFLKFIFKFGSSGTTSADIGSGLFSSWFAGPNISFSNFAVSFFFLFYVLLCIYCYIKVVDSNEMFLNYTIYISAAAFLCFFVFIPAYPYWYILIAPFVVLLVFMNDRQFKTNLLIETIGMASLFFLQQISGAWWCFSYKLFVPSFWNKIFVLSPDFVPKNTHDVISTVGSKFGIDNFLVIINLLLSSIFIAAIIALLVINNPKLIGMTDGKKEDIIVERSIIHFRNFITILLGFVPIVVLLFNMI